MSVGFMIWCSLMLILALSTVKAEGCLVIAPKEFRVGVEETVGIWISEASYPFNVGVYLMDYPEKARTFAFKELKIENDKPHLTTISLEPLGLEYLPQFVYLVIRSLNGNFELHSVRVAVRKYSGYVFLQTDKPLYLPNQKVQIRIISLNEKLLPSREPLTLEVKNPSQVLVKTRDITPPETGIAESDLQLSSSPIYGNWSITVRYGYQNSAKSLINFQVKEYVLPTFSVTIDAPRTISQSTQTISGIVTSKYVYGKPVQGTVILTYGIKSQRGHTVARGNLTSNELDKDTGQFTFTVDVKKALLELDSWWFGALSEFVLKAVVVEHSSGKRENSVSSIMLTDKPYVISFSDSSLDFKPGFLYQMQVQVHHANGDALDEPIQIKLEEASAFTTSGRTLPSQGQLITTDKRGRVSYSIATGSKDSTLQLTVKTVALGIPSNTQARNTLVVRKFNSPDKETFLKISVPPKEIPVDYIFSTSVAVLPTNSKTNIYYVVVSRGTILIFDKAASTEDGYVQAIQFRVTANMSPNARLIAFTVKDGNVIADSVRLDVQWKSSYNNLKGLQLKLRSSVESVAPGEAGDFYIQGEPGSFVGIAGADEALLSLNKGEHLTDKKLVSEINSRDLGSGAVGGATTQKVFSNAGLLLLCYPKISRAEDERREIQGITGLQGLPGLDVSFIAAVSPFEPFEPIEEDFEEPEPDEEDILSSIRHLFPETLFFKTVQIGGVGCKRLTSAGDGCLYNFTVPHSITTWQVQAVGISKTSGIAIAEPLRIRVFKRVFLQMDLPYVATQKEQLEVPVTVFNYGSNDLTARVFMYGLAGVCMGRTDGKASTPQKVNIPASSSKTVVFLVMPLRAKEYTLRVKVVTSDGTHDAIAKVLKVVPQGKEKEETISYVLDPAGIENLFSGNQLQGVTKEMSQDSKHKIKVNFERPNDYIPGSGKCTVSIIGSLLGQAVETTLSEATQDFIRLPTGCGEQAMVHMAPLVYTMMYLNHSKQMTPTTKEKGIRLMEDGFSHQLKFRKHDGSFAVFTSWDSSTWLTAFVARVFCQADNFIRVSRDPAYYALTWLLAHQHETGYFFESYKVFDKKLMGAVAEDITLTAFVLITIHECNMITFKPAQARAKTFLEDHVAYLQRPFDVAITAYALKLSNSAKATIAFNKLRNLSSFNSEANVRYWNANAAGLSQDQLPWVYRERPDSVAVETTAYALLTSLLFNDLTYSHPIANWLNQQRSGRGSFASTQDTVVALQALAEYTSKAVPNVPNMACNVSSQGLVQHSRSIYINKENALQIQKIEIPGHEAVEVTAEGTGLASVSVAVSYNVGPRSEEECKFEVNIRSSERKEAFHYENPDSYNAAHGEIEDPSDVFVFAETDEEDVHDIMNIEICVRFLEDVPAKMSILDVGLFTGYKPILEELRNLTVNRDLTKVSSYEVANRSVIIYLDEVPVDKPLCLNVKAIRIIKVGLVQPAAVKIYDYYHPEKTCTSFYQPDGESSMLQTICQGKQCTCVESLIQN